MHLEIARALIAARADVNATTAGGETALIVSARQGRSAMAQLLLAAGADANARTAKGETALSLATAGGFPDVATLLQSAGLATPKDIFRASGDGDLFRVKEPLAAGADANARTHGGATPLILAAEEGHAEIVRALLAANANVNATADFGDTPLIRAARNGRSEIVQILLAAAAAVNSKKRRRGNRALRRLGNRQRARGPGIARRQRRRQRPDRRWTNGVVGRRGVRRSPSSESPYRRQGRLERAGS